MTQTVSYQEIFSGLAPWMPQIISCIKKDCKNDHLKTDRAFCRKHLAGKMIHKVGIADLSSAYTEALSEGNEKVGEFVANRWVLRNAEVYELFETELRKIRPDFDQIDELGAEESEQLIGRSVEVHGPSRTYLFAVLNAVAFPKDKLEDLRAKAEAEREAQAAEQAQVETTQSAEQLIKRHEREIARLTDRYEKRIDGLQRKLLGEVATLKKQIAGLQRRLQEKA